MNQNVWDAKYCWVRGGGGGRGREGDLHKNWQNQIKKVDGNQTKNNILYWKKFMRISISERTHRLDSVSAQHH